MAGPHLKLSVRLPAVILFLSKYDCQISSALFKGGEKKGQKNTRSFYVLVRYYSAEFLLIGILESKDLIRVP